MNRKFAMLMVDIMIMIMIISIATAVSVQSSPTGQGNPSTTTFSSNTSNKKVTPDIESVLKLAGLQAARLGQYGYWPPLSSIEEGKFEFDYSQNVNGAVSPVNYKGRHLGSYASIYKKVNANLTSMEERTSARKGNYKSEESLAAISIFARAGSWLIQPPILNILDEYGLLTNDLLANKDLIISDKSIEYSGKGINNLECFLDRVPSDVVLSAGRQQYVNTNFLYNKNLTKESKSSVTQESYAEVDSIVTPTSAGSKVTGNLNYSLNSQSSGIADINYGKVYYQPKYHSTRSIQGPLGLLEIQIPAISNTKAGSMYTVENEVHERYAGDYNIAENIQMSSVYEIEKTDENWVPCCFEGWDTMPPIYQRKFGRDTKGTFDCRCHLSYAYGIDVPLIPMKAEFNNSAPVVE